MDYSKKKKLKIESIQHSVSFSHAEAAAAWPPHHADPFDRMLVAQAISEGLTLVTHDRRLEAYEAPILWT